MSEEKAKAREFIIPATWQVDGKKYTDSDVATVILKQDHEAALQEAQKEIAELKAKLWVAKDNALRNYDGLAEKADKYDEAKEMLEKMASAINKAIYNDDYGSEADEIPMDTLRNIIREYENWKIKNRNG